MSSLISALPKQAVGTHHLNVGQDARRPCAGDELDAGRQPDADRHLDHDADRLALDRVADGDLGQHAASGP